MRISDHLLCCGAAALDLGAITAFLYAFNEREKIYDIAERAAGQRYHPSYTRVGGLTNDVDDEWIAQIRAFVKSFPAAHADVTRLLNHNRIFVDRTRGIGLLSREEAINRSCTGPVARASGVVRDVRKDEPYLAYRDFDFKVVCSKAGDCYARYLVPHGGDARKSENRSPGHREFAERTDQCGRQQQGSAAGPDGSLSQH